MRGNRLQIPALLDWARAAGFAACLTVALGGSLFWAFGDYIPDSHECHEPTQQKTVAQKQYLRTQKLASVRDLLPTAEGGDQSQDTKHYYECLLAEYTRQLAAFTKGLALATILLVIVTGGLVVFAWRQSKDMQESIKVATRSADHTEDAFRRLERPYLLPHFDNMTTHHLRVKFVPHGVPFMTFKMANFGKLPAILRSVSVGLINNPMFPLRTTFALERKSYDVIAPGGVTSEMRLEVVGGEVGQPFLGQSATLLVLHGIVKYEDPTGALHTDSFLMRGMTNAAGFAIDGGDEYNWTETEYPPPRPHHVRSKPRV